MKTISKRHQGRIARSLCRLTQSGIPLRESMAIVSEQPFPKATRLRLRSACIALDDGASLAQALSKNGLFTPHHLQLIHIGEHTSSLAANLQHIAEHLRKRDAAQKKILSLMAYPAAIVIGICGITYFLIAYIFPKIRPMFASLQAELPPSTRLLMRLSDDAKHYGIAIIAACSIVTMLLTAVLRRYKDLRRMRDAMLLRTPFCSRLIKTHNLLLISQTLGALASSGLQLPQSLAMTAEAVRNEIYKQLILQARDSVIAGHELSGALGRHPRHFPESFVCLIGIGEKTGTLPDIFLSLARDLEEELEISTKSLTSLIEPTLMATMGLIIGFVSFSIISPIYSLTQTIQR